MFRPSAWKPKVIALSMVVQLPLSGFTPSAAADDFPDGYLAMTQERVLLMAKALPHCAPVIPMTGVAIFLAGMSPLFIPVLHEIEMTRPSGPRNRTYREVASDLFSNRLVAVAQLRADQPCRTHLHLLDALEQRMREKGYLLAPERVLQARVGETGAPRATAVSGRPLKSAETNPVAKGDEEFGHRTRVAQ